MSVDFYFQNYSCLLKEMFCGLQKEKTYYSNTETEKCLLFDDIPWSSSRPSPTSRVKKFLKKNFSPFSGLDGGSSQQTVEVRRIFIGA